MTQQTILISRTFKLLPYLRCPVETYTTLTTELPFFFDFNSENFIATPVDSEQSIVQMETSLMEKARISALVLQFTDGKQIRMDLRIPFTKYKNQFKASIRLYGDYVSDENERAMFNDEIDLDVFHNLRGAHRGGFVAITGRFVDKQGSCGYGPDLKSFCIAEVELSSELNISV